MSRICRTKLTAKIAPKIPAIMRNTTRTASWPPCSRTSSISASNSALSASMSAALPVISTLIAPSRYSLETVVSSGAMTGALSAAALPPAPPMAPPMSVRMNATSTQRQKFALNAALPRIFNSFLVHISDLSPFEKSVIIIHFFARDATIYSIIILLIYVHSLPQGRQRERKRI